MRSAKPSPRKYIAPVIITAVVVAFAAGLIALLVWALSLDAVPAPVLVYLGIYIVTGGLVIFGMVYCLRQRCKEIQGGEEDEASQY